MADFYIEYTRTVTEVYRVEAKNDKEAKELVKKITIEMHLIL